ncbi:hypothetical protein [Arthrobacter sp. MMS18-M83]|uniref:hypothetical protein n=1 Tax=Arthrobacter sp. MMS18-M83 TaxID=2996261 RepID=UPI00227BD914|nr:hypothetical protein [Arthrobacter sp. MMS18-M83]WAH95993.1 hypothetical protein OW521_16360 [Arthrobacter sp. MMS18-M83]
MSTAVVEPGGGTSSTENTEKAAPVAERDGSRPSPNLARQPGRRKALVLSGVCTVAWAASVSAGALVDCGPDLHRAGLACHIIALVLSFGAILVVDWVGFLWLMGKRDIHDTRRLETAAQPLIWGGLAVLLVSGALIKPDITSPVTQVKLLCVLVLMLNGIALAPAMRRLHALPVGTHFKSVALRLRARLLVALCISQGCWWTAVLVGLLNSTLRRWAGD